MSAAPTLQRANAVEPLPRPIEAAACRLYESHSRLVLSYCRRRLRNPEDAEDAAQTTFVYALRALRRGVVPEVDSAWLITIARNVCHERWNSARRRGEIEATHDPQTLQEVAPAVEGANGDAALLREALRSLPEQQRRAVVLREWHGLPYREIADELRISQAATEALLFRARRSLAAALGGADGNGKRLRALDVGPLLAGLKPLLGGASAVKLTAVVAATAAAIAVSAGGAQRIVSDEQTPTRPAALHSADVAPVVPSVAEAVPARPPRLATPRAQVGERAGQRPVRKDRSAGATKKLAPAAPGNDAGSTGDAVSGATRVTEPVEATIADTVATVKGVVPTLPALPEASTLLPSTEAPTLDVADVSLP